MTIEGGPFWSPGTVALIWRDGNPGSIIEARVRTYLNEVAAEIDRPRDTVFRHVQLSNKADGPSVALFGRPDDAFEAVYNAGTEWETVGELDGAEIRAPRMLYRSSFESEATEAKTQAYTSSTAESEVPGLFTDDEPAGVASAAAQEERISVDDEDDFWGQRDYSLPKLTAREALDLDVKSAKRGRRRRLPPEQLAAVVARHQVERDAGAYTDRPPAPDFDAAGRDQLLANAREDAAHALGLCLLIARRQRRMLFIGWAVLALLSYIAWQLS